MKKVLLSVIIVLTFMVFANKEADATNRRVVVQRQRQRVAVQRQVVRQQVVRQHVQRVVIQQPVIQQVIVPQVYEFQTITAPVYQNIVRPQVQAVIVPQKQIQNSCQKFCH